MPTETSHRLKQRAGNVEDASPCSIATVFPSARLHLFDERNEFGHIQRVLLVEPAAFGFRIAGGCDRFADREDVGSALSRYRVWSALPI